MKKLFSIISWPLLFVVGQFFVIFIATLLFILFNKSLYADIELAAWLETPEFTETINQFLSHYGFIILIVIFLVFFPVLYKKYNKEVKETKTKILLSDSLLLIVLGFSISLVYNSACISVNNVFEISNLFSESNNNYLNIIIGTIVVGPILEEYIFRGIVYHRLLKNNSFIKSMILTGIVFALTHSNIVQIIYAFIFNFVLVVIYEKYSSIKSSSIVHMSANSVALIIPFLIHMELLVRNLVMGIGIILLIVSWCLILKENKDC